MKPDHMILYDAACPMCGLYTKLFVRWRWLTPEGRQPFCQAQQQQLTAVDWQKARHCIPLLRRDAPTLYGLDALLAIIGPAHPWIRRLATLPLLHTLLTILYSFISYNRRILAGSRGALESAPDLHRGWRLTWMIPALTITLLVLRHWPLPFAPAPALAWIWTGLMLAGGITIMRGWDAWGRWTTHLLLSSLLWSLVLLLPPGPARVGATTTALLLLGLEARHRFFQSMPPETRPIRK